jgi:hypothetical protein
MSDHEVGTLFRDHRTTNVFLNLELLRSKRKICYKMRETLDQDQ